jgi:serine protease Do
VSLLSGAEPEATASGVDIPAVAAAVMPSVVSITTSSRGYYGQQMGGGSGVILRRDGVVVTNNHVIEGANEAVAQLSDGREFPCRLVGRDSATDIAVLQMVGAPAADLVPVTFGDSEGVRLGESVLAVGNPFGLSGTVTMGIVSALGRADVGIVDYEEFIQTDAAINPGNSGGALVNMRGELIGINTAILSRSGGSQGIGFAIPVHLLRPITESLIERGRVDRRWLGIYIAALNPHLAKRIAAPAGARGVVVRSLVRGGPADLGKLLPGDLIQRVEERIVDSPAKLRNAIAHRSSGDTVRVELLRQGEPLTLTLVLAPLPKERSAFPRQR